MNFPTVPPHSRFLTFDQPGGKLDNEEQLLTKDRHSDKVSNNETTRNRKQQKLNNMTLEAHRLREKNFMTELPIWNIATVTNCVSQLDREKKGKEEKKK